VKGACNVHMRGNERCPNPPMFVVGWDQAKLASDGRHAHQRLWRRTCGFHLVRTMEEALFNSYDGASVVKLAGDE